jgi:tetratricopeptide (TPR) repeat protein
MIKFLSTIIFLALSYLAIIVVSKYDTMLSIGLFDYRIDVSLFLLITFFIILVCISSLGIRILAIIFKTPYMIAAKLAGYKKNSHTKLILDAYANMIMGKTDLAQRNISKIDPVSSYKEFADHINLLKAVSNLDSERNTYLLHNLLSNKQYHDFSAKALARKLYDQGLYQQSLSFIEHVRIDSNMDRETIYLLILLYANLNIWDNFNIHVERYNGIFKDITEAEKGEIGNLYLRCAKYYLAQGEEQESVKFLEKSLTYNPVSIESIELLCTINVSLGQNNQNLAILETAFTAVPSFELFDLYYQSSSMSPIAIYDKFYDLVDARLHKDVFLAIAAYLKLFDRVDTLLSCEI